jgi:hypothetical protein
MILWSAHFVISEAVKPCQKGFPHSGQGSPGVRPRWSYPQLGQNPAGGVSDVELAGSGWGVIEIILSSGRGRVLPAGFVCDWEGGG